MPINALENALASVPDSMWAEIRSLSKPISAKLSRFGWCNNKYYRRNPENESGCVEQISRSGEREIPYQREFFHTCLSRFAIPNRPVAYFSHSFTINVCETIDVFRLNPELSRDELSCYFEGKMDPTRGLKGYAMKVKLSDRALILDLVDNSLPFIDYLVSSGGWWSRQEFLNSTILSRNPGVYEETQLISREALRRGFQGVCYQSVRIPNDIRVPDRNLVVFDRSIVKVRQYC